MGALYDKAQNLSGPTSSGGGSLYERAQQVGTPAPVAQPVAPTAAPRQKFTMAERLGENALVPQAKTPEVTVSDVVRGIPEATVDTAKAFTTTFVPAITNFFKTTGGILGEGLAYAVDPEVRKQYGAGNLDILPTITETTQAKLAKATIAAGIEAAVYRNIPKAMSGTILERGGIGALQGVGFAVSEGLANNRSPQEIVDSMPLYGIPGGVIGVVAPYLLPLLKTELKTIPQGLRKVFGASDEGVKSLAVTGEEVVPTKIPISTPNTRYEAYLKSQGYEPYVPESQLPVIDAGKNTNKGPFIQLEPKPSENIPKGTRLVPEPTQPPTSMADTGPVPKEPTIQADPTMPADAVVPEQRLTKVASESLPVAGDVGEAKVSRLEARMKGVLDTVPPEKADAAGITTYNQMNKADQIKKAATFVEQNADDAMAILRGEKPAPDGILHNSIALALEKKAETAADANLAIKLASLRSTRAGQEISILTEADPTNVVSQIREVIEARAQRAARRSKVTPKAEIAKDVTEGRQVLTRSQLQIAEAEKLLDALVC